MRFLDPFPAVLAPLDFRGAEKRERVRGSSLVDWPVYQRLTCTMRATTRKKELLRKPRLLDRFGHVLRHAPEFFQATATTEPRRLINLDQRFRNSNCMGRMELRLSWFKSPCSFRLSWFKGPCSFKESLY